LDERYKKFVGRKVVVPILGREVPVIADDYVTREFGSGALKITPGHDPNDYAIAQRHGLPVLSMLDREAKVTETGGPYAGLDRFVCREKIWADMRTAGLVIKDEPYTVNIPRSQRGGEIVEPMISEQWFVKIEPLAQPALEAVRDGRIRIIPERFEKSLLQLDGKYQGLVHLPPVVVGTPHPGLVLRRLRQTDLRTPRPARLRPLRQQKHPPGPGRAGYLVLVRAVAFLYPRLAGRDA